MAKRTPVDNSQNALIILICFRHLLTLLHISAYFADARFRTCSRIDSENLRFYDFERRFASMVAALLVPARLGVQSLLSAAGSFCAEFLGLLAARFYGTYDNYI